MKVVLAAFNQKKALVGAFSVITNLRMELFEALVKSNHIMMVTTLPRALHAASTLAVAAAMSGWLRSCLGVTPRDIERSEGPSVGTG